MSLPGPPLLADLLKGNQSLGESLSLQSGCAVLRWQWRGDRTTSGLVLAV